MEEGKRQGPRRGEYCARPSRQARLNTGNERIKTSAARQTGRMHRRLPAVLPPPPFPFAAEAQTHCRSFHRAAPPSRRGANACAHPMPWIRPPSSRPHRHNPLKSPKDQRFPQSRARRRGRKPHRRKSCHIYMDRFPAASRGGGLPAIGQQARRWTCIFHPLLLLFPFVPPARMFL